MELDFGGLKSFIGQVVMERYLLSGEVAALKKLLEEARKRQIAAETKLAELSKEP